jgi:hypothetical protein
VEFNANQVFLCTRQLPQMPPPAPTQSCLLTLDTLTCQANQFTSMVRVELPVPDRKFIIRPRPALIANVYGLASLMQCSGNRVSELLLDAQISMLTVAAQNVTTGNNATHCIFAAGSTTYDPGNLELDDGSCESSKDFGGTLVLAYQHLAYAVLGLPQGDDEDRPASYFDPILVRQAAAVVVSIVMFRSALIWKKRMLQRQAALGSYTRLPRLSRGLCSHPIELPSEGSLASIVEGLELRQDKLRKVSEQAVSSMSSFLGGANESYTGVSTEASSAAQPGAGAGQPVESAPEAQSTTPAPEQAKAKDKPPAAGETPPIVSKPSEVAEVAKEAKSAKTKAKGKSEKDAPVDEEPAPPKKPSEES